jgi:choline-sulfatase
MPVQKPNILYIHSDQHTAAVTGCYGDPVVQTPNLDSLANNGVRFTNVYCPSPVCVPSRMSMLAGRYPYELQVWTNNHILDSGTPTFAHAMGAAGYRPVLIGRMHALGTDQLHGYTERPIGDHSSNFPGSGKAAAGLGKEVQRAGPGQSAYEVHDDDVTACAVDFLNRLGDQKRGGSQVDPFSLSVGYILPHSPYVARREDYERYRNSVTMPKHRVPFSDNLHPFEKWWREWGGTESVAADDIRRARIAYWALVASMDRMIGRILEALDRNGLAENTMVLYMSDHGDMAGERDLWMKRCYYEDSVKVPAILSWPGVVSKGTVCDRVLSSLDFNATMLDAIGAPPLPGSHGRSVLNLLRNSDTDWDDIALSEYCVYEGWTTRMIRRGPWKYCYYHGHKPQLFNLDEDPDELHDLAQDPPRADIQESLRDEVLKDWDPDWVTDAIQRRKVDHDLYREWVSQTNPLEQFLWPMTPEMDFREEE